MPTAIDAFAGCASLKEIPEFAGGQPRNMNCTFKNCASLVQATESFFKGSSPSINLTSAFSGCTSLTKVIGLPIDGSSVSTDNMFKDCFSLSRLTFKDDGGTAGPDVNISLSDCFLGREALVEMFQSLPKAENGNKLDISRNPGTPDLTEEEKQIAVGRGWTLVTESDESQET